MRHWSVVLLLAAGCRLLPAPIPMTSTRYPMPGRDHPRCLVVLLPGAGDNAGTFKEEGFVDAIQKSGVSADVVSANATFGYYFKGISAERLELDLLAPARSAGYEQIWIIGISMGGFGSLDYGQRHSQEVSGILALAPYLGANSLGEEIRSAGGLTKWKPDPGAPITEDNYQRQLWSWLHRVTSGEEKGPALYLGFGDADGLGTQDAVLAAALPKERVFHAAGGHDWPPWRDLLQQFLQGSELKTACADN